VDLTKHDIHTAMKWWFKPEKWTIEFKQKYGRDYYKYRNKKKQRTVYNETCESSKILIIQFYSNNTYECKFCRENDLKELSIDHINGGGIKHRQEIKKKGGCEFYKWLIRNDLPDGYQILCLTCNSRKNERDIY